ncbi:MarR family winged helix-turn-helix transcriptional regulator [Ethanoligenens sp.]|uniref:MarR family winged helix-turn-helix transcriptional regulator n=1 Tax=Ethanoligenens sp. TaxID=2099655 RepID=UPI0039EADAFB
MLNKEPIDTIKLYTAIHRLGRQMHRCAHRIGHAEGYYREQSRLLMLIAENDGVIQRDLAEEMDVRPSSMTEMLSKMEQLGLVERRQDEKDQRVMHIFLTEQGKNAAKASQNATEEMANTLFAGLADEDVGKMLELTEKLCAHLDAMDSAELAQGASQHGHHRGFDYPHGHHGFGHHHHLGFSRF